MVRLARLMAISALVGFAAPLAAAQAAIDPIQPQEGVSIGIAVSEARGKLEAAGYKLNAGAVCEFQRNDNAAGVNNPLVWSKVVLEAEVPLVATEPVVRPPVSPGRSPSCDRKDQVVSRIAWTQSTGKAALDANKEFAALEARLGPVASCRGQTDQNFDTCLWWDLPNNKNVREIFFSATKARRAITVVGDPLAYLPQIPERAVQSRTIQARALTLCQTYNVGGGAELYRTLVDCSCVAGRVARAHAVGLVAEVTTKSLSDHDKYCPGEPRRMRAEFEAQCVKTYGNQGGKDEAWVRGGGCSCYGEHVSSAYRRHPRTSFGAIGSLGSAALLACKNSIAPVANERAAVSGAGGGASRSAAAPAPGLAPLDHPMLAGRVVGGPEYAPGGQGQWSGRSYLGLRRVLHLALLRDDPSLLENAGFAAHLAFDNLSPEAVKPFVRGEFCPLSCSWRGNSGVGRDDPFVQREAENRFRSERGPALLKLAAEAPREITALYRLQVGPYDAKAGGFPFLPPPGSTALAGPEESYLLRGGNLNRPEIVVRRVNNAPLPVFWKLSEPEAQRVLQKIGGAQSGSGVSPRHVVLAISYQLGRSRHRPTQYEKFFYVIDGTPLGVAIYTDGFSDSFVEPRDKIAETILPADGRISGGLVGATVGGIPVPAKPQLADASDALLPLELKLPPESGVGALQIGLKEHQAPRVFNLILVKAKPSLAQDPDLAVLLAQQNLAGLTRLDRPEWVGANEIDRRASEALYFQKGADVVRSLGVSLPREVVVLAPLPVRDYDFGKQAYLFQEGFLSQRFLNGKLDQVLLLPYTGDIVGKSSVSVRLNNGFFPTVWSLPEASAAKVKRQVTDANGDVRRLPHLVLRVRLSGVQSQNAPWIFSGDWVEIAVYEDQSMKNKIGILSPVKP